MSRAGIWTSNGCEVPPQVTTSLLASSCLHEPRSLHLCSCCPCQATVRSARMRQEGWHTGLTSTHHEHRSKVSACVPDCTCSCHPHNVTPISSRPLWSLRPSYICSHASTVSTILAFLMHTQHKFCTQAWNDPVARRQPSVRWGLYKYSSLKFKVGEKHCTF